jgi:hypothetical protein
MDLGGGMVDCLFCLVRYCNGILTPLRCLVCLGGGNTTAGCIIHKAGQYTVIWAIHSG